MSIKCLWNEPSSVFFFLVNDWPNRLVFQHVANHCDHHGPLNQVFALCISAQKSMTNVRLSLIFLQVAANPLKRDSSLRYSWSLSKAALDSGGINTSVLLCAAWFHMQKGLVICKCICWNTAHIEGGEKIHIETVITSKKFYSQVGHIPFEGWEPSWLVSASREWERVMTGAANNPVLGSQIWPFMSLPNGECCSARLFLELPRHPFSPNGQHSFFRGFFLIILRCAQMTHTDIDTSPSTEKDLSDPVSTVWKLRKASWDG